MIDSISLIDPTPVSSTLMQPNSQAQRVSCVLLLSPIRLRRLILLLRHLPRLLRLLRGIHEAVCDGLDTRADRLLDGLRHFVEGCADGGEDRAEAFTDGIETFA